MSVMVLVPSSALTNKLMKTQILHLFVALALLSTLILQPSTAFAQGTTTFTYQGQLRDGGTNANGAYTMIFKLYDAVKRRQSNWQRDYQQPDSLQRTFRRES